MSGENYAFTPWDSEDDIAKFFPDDIEKLAFAPLIAGALGRFGAKTAAKTVLTQGVKGAAKTGMKKLGKKFIKDKATSVGVNAASQLTGGGATSAASTNAASEAVESVTPEPAAAAPAVETPEPASTEPAAPAESPEGKSKSNTKQMGMQMASQMMAQGAQKKQAQEQRAMERARRGATISTGTPMEVAMRLLKQKPLNEMTDYEIDRARFTNDTPELTQEERTRAMDRMTEFARQNATPFDFGDEVEEEYDKIGDQDHSDYFGDDIDSNELYQYILENGGEEAAQNYVQQYKEARGRYGGHAATMSQLGDNTVSNQDEANDFIESREKMIGDLGDIMPNDESIFDAFPYPDGVVYNNKLSPPFTSTPQNEGNFQMKYAGEPMEVAMRLLKGPVYPAFGLDNFNQYIAPLGDAISQGHDDFQHVNTTPTSEAMREHLQTQTDLRVDNSRTRNYPVPNDHNHNYDSPSNQFLMDSHLQLEHLMRTQPTLFNDIKEGQRVFLQTGVVPQGWDSNPSLELPRESPHYVRNTYNQRTRTGGTLDHHSGRNISERIHSLVKKPHDLGVVYHRKDGKFTPLTTSPTAMWKPKKSNKFLSARPMGVFQNDIPAKHKEEISARHRQYNGENGFMGVPVANQASVLRHSHKEPEIREEPKKVGVRGTISGELPETLNSHYSSTKNGLNIKGGIGKKWADQSNANSLPRRISTINDAHDIGLINQNDKGVLFTYLIQAAIDSGHVKMHDLTSPFNQKGWKVNDDETWKEAIMNISKAEMQRIEDVLLKERKSPEAFRHKKEYDSKYEASPERVKYREGLNNERRKRGMYGDHSHRDISHTEGGKLTVENEHDNRARHFKDEGTLRPIAKSMRDDLELLRNLMNGPMDEQDKKIAESLLASIDEEEGEDSEVSSELEHPYPI